ncbi:hypothetical protein ACWCSH_09145 [Streptosporangium sp. NPDC001682]
MAETSRTRTRPAPEAEQLLPIEQLTQELRNLAEAVASGSCRPRPTRSPG